MRSGAQVAGWHTIFARYWLTEPNLFSFAHASHHPFPHICSGALPGQLRAGDVPQRGHQLVRLGPALHDDLKPGEGVRRRTSCALVSLVFFLPSVLSAWLAMTGPTYVPSARVLLFLCPLHGRISAFARHFNRVLWRAYWAPYSSPLLPLYPTTTVCGAQGQRVQEVREGADLQDLVLWYAGRWIT